MPQLDVFREGDLTERSTEADDGVLYRVEAGLNPAQQGVVFRLIAEI